MTKGKGGYQNGPWGKASGSGGGSGRPPKDEDKIVLPFKPGQFKNPFNDESGMKMLVFGFVIFVFLWFASGLYVVDPEQQGVVLRFGKYHRTTQPGLNYHLPYPFETVYTPEVTRVQRVEIGYRGFEGSEQPVPSESLMLTGDENIADISFNVQWKVKDAKDFLFNVRNQAQTVKDVAESVMREVISNSTLENAQTVGKQEIQDISQKLLQETLDKYKAGIMIERVSLLNTNPPAEVMEAHRDVQAAAADKERMIKEAGTYSNEILPKARGAAEKLEQEAAAYYAEKTKRAEGDAARFISIYNEYRNAPAVTRRRIYLETMEEVLQGMNKVIMDQSGNQVVPYMALPAVTQKKEDKP